MPWRQHMCAQRSRVSLSHRWPGWVRISSGGSDDGTWWHGGRRDISNGSHLLWNKTHSGLPNRIEVWWDLKCIQPYVWTGPVSRWHHPCKVIGQGISNPVCNAVISGTACLLNRGWHFIALCLRDMEAQGNKRQKSRMAWRGGFEPPGRVATLD